MNLNTNKNWQKKYFPFFFIILFYSDVYTKEYNNLSTDYILYTQQMNPDFNKQLDEIEKKNEHLQKQNEKNYPENKETSKTQIEIGLKQKVESIKQRENNLQNELENQNKIIDQLKNDINQQNNIMNKLKLKIDEQHGDQNKNKEIVNQYNQEIQKKNKLVIQLSKELMNKDEIIKKLNEENIKLREIIEQLQHNRISQEDSSKKHSLEKEEQDKKRKIDRKKECCLYVFLWNKIYLGYSVIPYKMPNLQSFVIRDKPESGLPNYYTFSFNDYKFDKNISGVNIGIGLYTNRDIKYSNEFSFEFGFYMPPHFNTKLYQYLLAYEFRYFPIDQFYFGIGIKTGVTRLDYDFGICKKYQINNTNLTDLSEKSLEGEQYGFTNDFLYLMGFKVGDHLEFYGQIGITHTIFGDYHLTYNKRVKSSNIIKDDGSQREIKLQKPESKGITYSFGFIVKF